MCSCTICNQVGIGLLKKLYFTKSYIDESKIAEINKIMNIAKEVWRREILTSEKIANYSLP